MENSIGTVTVEIKLKSNYVDGAAFGAHSFMNKALIITSRRH